MTNPTRLETRRRIQLVLLVLFPLMFMVASAEGTSRSPTFLWPFQLLPLLFLPWLFFRRHRDEIQGPSAVVRHLAIHGAATEELTALVGPAVQVDRAYATTLH